MNSKERALRKESLEIIARTLPVDILKNMKKELDSAESCPEVRELWLIFDYGRSLDEETFIKCKICKNVFGLKTQDICPCFCGVSRRRVLYAIDQCIALRKEIDNERS